MIQIHRYEDQIRAYEQYPIETGKVLLYGSSFFANWGYERAQKQWYMASDGKLDVVNHGFGGATVEELLYHYHRLVLPYQPSAVVLRTGHNDTWVCTAEEAIILTQRLIDWLKNDFPGIRIVALKAFDHPSATSEMLEKRRCYNRLLEELARKDPQLYTVDLDPFFYQSKEDIGSGKNFRDVFISDGLHLTDSGYEQMASYLMPLVSEYLSESAL